MQRRRQLFHLAAGKLGLDAGLARRRQRTLRRVRANRDNCLKSFNISHLTLHAANIATLNDLVNYCNVWGHRWWRRIDRLGEVRAARIIRWIERYADSLNYALSRRATVQRKVLKKDFPDDLNRIVRCPLLFYPHPPQPG